MNYDFVFDGPVKDFSLTSHNGLARVVYGCHRHEHIQVPKIVDYPRAPLSRALALAEAVDRLGGEATDESAAEGIGSKVHGAFRALVSAANKYGLVTMSKGIIRLEPLFRDYKLSYTDEQKREALRRAFLNPPLFAAVAKRLEGQVVPAHFEKLLIREHDVGADMASRVVLYFNEGARDAGLFGPGGIITTNPGGVTGQVVAREGIVPPPSTTPNADVEDDSDSPISVPNTNGYTVRITGPGMDSRIAINDEEDIEIVEVTLKKVKKLLKAQQQEPIGGTES